MATVFHTGHDMLGVWLHGCKTSVDSLDAHIDSPSMLPYIDSLSMLMATSSLMVTGGPVWVEPSPLVPPSTRLVYHLDRIARVPRSHPAAGKQKVYPRKPFE